MTKPNIEELVRLAEGAKVGLASGNWRPDPYGITQIWGDSLKGGDTQVAMIRGWGYLTGGGQGALGLSEDEALAIQKAWGEFIAALNPATFLQIASDLKASQADNERLRERLEQVRNTTDHRTGYSDLSARRAAFKVADQALTGADK